MLGGGKGAGRGRRHLRHRAGSAQRGEVAADGDRAGLFAGAVWGWCVSLGSKQQPAHGFTRYEIAGSIAERRQGVAGDGDLVLPPGGNRVALGLPAVILSAWPGGQHRLGVAVANVNALPAMIEAAVDTGTWVEPLSPEPGVFGTVVEKVARAGAMARWWRCRPGRAVLQRRVLETRS